MQIRLLQTVLYTSIFINNTDEFSNILTIKIVSICFFETLDFHQQLLKYAVRQKHFATSSKEIDLLIHLFSLMFIQKLVFIRRNSFKTFY
jgi:hypothetical protein